MQKIKVSTNKKRQILDITRLVNEQITKTGKKQGVCVLLVAHTTAGLTTADLDPGTDLDMLDAFEEIIPNLDYRHPHDPKHTPDHILSALVGTNLSLPFEMGELVLGTWQRVVLCEFDGPRERSIIVSIMSEEE